MWLPVISSFSLRLLRGFYTMFLFLFPLSTTFQSCVPQTLLPLNVVRRSLGHGSRIQQLRPPVRLHLDLLHPHLLPPLLWAMCHSGTSWRSCSIWMGGFTLEAFPPPPPVVSDFKEEHDDDGDDDDAGWPLLTYIVLIFFICWCMFLSPTLTCVVSFLFLCTCFLLFVCNLLFLFHTKMPWWVLFKVFQKYRFSKSTCHKLSSCKSFLEFVFR